MKLLISRGIRNLPGVWHDEITAGVSVRPKLPAGIGRKAQHAVFLLKND
jgi:hypothetical protein